MVRKFSGKAALVTGGSSGIGRATALAFAREGAKLIIADVDDRGGAETVQMTEESGGKAIFPKADVSKPADVAGMVSKAVQAYGQLPCAFNNPGVGGGAPLHEYLEEL